MSDEAYDASDPEQVRPRRKKIQAASKDDDAALLAMMQNPAGRRSLWRIISRCGVYQTSMTGNSQTFFLEGQRNIGLWLMAECERVDRKTFVSLLNEHMEI